MTEPAVETYTLVKTFNGIKAVKGIDLTIERGELFGFLGPNGAGKTTTISMLCTILKPTSGTARVWGHDISKEPDHVRSSIGIVFQDPSLDDQLTARENLRFHARLYKVSREEIDRRINELLEIVELQDRADDVVKTYSGGMRRRLEIARGLLHHPHVLFLDEPTLGLDPQTRRHIWTYIERLNKEQQVTILLTTHYMDEANYLCNRIAIIDHGTIVAQDSPAKLKESLGGDVVSLTATPISDELLASLRAVDNVKEVKVVDSTIQLTIANSKKTIPLLFDTVARCDASVSSISLREPTLDDVFMKYTGHELREEKDAGKSYMMRQRMRRRMRR
jgi:ABC-2 type transport system ATP-binding protein